jgi:hypothetical protein
MSYEGYALVERVQPTGQKSPLMLWLAEENTNFLLKEKFRPSNPTISLISKKNLQVYI